MPKFRIIKCSECGEEVSRMQLGIEQDAIDSHKEEHADHLSYEQSEIEE